MPFFHTNSVFSLDTWIWCLLKFYELCGFHRRSVNSSIILLQATLLFYFTLNEVNYIWAISEFMERLGVLNFSIFYGALLITYWLTVIASNIQKSAQETFWKINEFNCFGQRNTIVFMSIWSSFDIVFNNAFYFKSGQKHHRLFYHDLLHASLLVQQSVVLFSALPENYQIRTDANVKN